MPNLHGAARLRHLLPPGPRGHMYPVAGFRGYNRPCSWLTSHIGIPGTFAAHEAGKIAEVPSGYRPGLCIVGWACGCVEPEGLPA